MVKLKRLIPALALAAVFPAVAADDPFSEAEILLCAVDGASVCDAEGACQPTSPEVVRFARFARINLKDREMRSVWPTELDRSTFIEQIIESEGLILMQGIDDQVAWTLNLEKPSGRFVAAASGRAAVFVLTGTCMPQLPE